jgi:hypothetical protein
MFCSLTMDQGLKVTLCLHVKLAQFPGLSEYKKYWCEFCPDGK